MERYTITNDEIIEAFHLTSSSDVKLNRIIFKSDEKTARHVAKELSVMDFYDDVHLDFHNYPVVLTVIYCRYKPNIDNFLELQSIRAAFTQAMQ